MIYELDTTVSAIDAQLASRSSTKPSEQRLPIVVGSCRTCHTLFVADARYCMKCGARWRRPRSSSRPHDRPTQSTGPDAPR